MGTIVRTFSSTDADTAAHNIAHLYTIESGGLNEVGDVSYTLLTINHNLITFLYIQQVLCIPNEEVPTITVCGSIDKEGPLDYITVIVLISNPTLSPPSPGCGLPTPDP